MTFTPICVPCATEMRCKKNDYCFTEYEAAAVWAGDMYECPACKAQIVVGAGSQPVAESHEPQFAAAQARSRLELRRAHKG